MNTNSEITHDQHEERQNTILDFTESPTIPTVIEDLNTSSSIQWSSPVNFGKLGREIKISPKSRVDINQPPVGIKFHVPSVSLVIGIGKDHVGYLFMDVEAWKALKEGEEIIIDTLKEFQKKFL